MKIRVKRSFSMYKPGQVFDWPRGMCRLLIARGMIEEVIEPVIEAAAEPEPVIEAAADTTKPTRRRKK
jgi:hypothetical protein